MEEKRENNVEVKSVEGDFHNATGPVRIRMTNDYLFKALLQKNEKVLRGLICSMLHMEEAVTLSFSVKAYRRKISYSM